MRVVPPVDLRLLQRVPATISISIVVESEAFQVERQASTIDFSVRGARVRTSFALLSGETVGIITMGDSRHTISARVVWAHRVGTDLWSLVGLAFLDTLPA